MDEDRDKETGESSNSQQPSKPRDIPCSSGGRSPILGAAVMFPSSVPASPPSFISLEQLLKAAEDVSKSGFNMALAHEIAVNKDFKLQQNVPKSSLEEKVTEIFHKAFWDLLTEQLSSDPPEYTQAMVLLKEIKEILIWLLLPHNTRLKNEINEVLDLDLIEQQAEKGIIDVLSYAQFIISTMARICAPARDAKIKELRQLTEVVPLYKGILGTLDLMKMDMVNFTISRMRPHIQQHSIEYEQGKFKEILQSLEGLTPPVDGLKFTRLWLQNVYNEVMETYSEGDPPNSLILRRAYLKILRWKKAEYFPETLHLDHERFITLRDDLTVMVLTATVILVTYSTVGPAIQGITDFKNTLKSHVQILLADAPQCSSQNDFEAKMETVGLQVAKEVNECLDKHGYTVLDKENESSLIAMIKKTASEDHNVRQLIMKRVLEFLELALHTSSNLKIPPGLSSLQNELSVFAGQFLSLIKHNQAVFEEYYNTIINEAKSKK
ncbi:T-complex protein 11-like protein 1 isoform X1 [Argiope bruennichi]|uniref:T-complex protein 11-like protein 1 isoform X1 n=1 Tax=Argiope bruennichi TaxID=94029 RepID=UPI002494F741|nr:T-complex protein 11-like protein 1 isoform X1 [Argiope bruennichi]